jgi:hypothetical protein
MWLSCWRFRDELASDMPNYLHLSQKYQSKLRSAATKDEALTLAIGAAENLMKALKLSSDANEKKRLKAQCSDIMNVAGRIKNDANWTPQGEPPRATTKNAQIGQWAAEVVTAQSSAGLEDTASQPSLSRRGLSSTTAPVDNLSVPSGNISTSSFSLVTRSEYGQERSYVSRCPAPGAPALLLDLSDDPFPSSRVDSGAPTNARHEGRPNAKPPPVAGAQMQSSALVNASAFSTSPTQRFGRSVAEEGATSATPSTAAYSQIHRLAEPISTRKRSKREDIILLKASMVNGFKCPPWDRNPSPAEFAAEQGVELFMYVQI